MRVTGLDACRRGWVEVSLDGAERAGVAARLQVEAVRVHQTLAGALDSTEARVVGIDMPLGLPESGWREADRAARAARAQAQLGLCHPAPGGLGAG